MKQYAIYLRKSRADEEAEKYGDGETLARHEKALLELAKKKKLNIVKIYKEVVSGETIAARPEVQNLLRDVEQSLYDGVLVMEIERLARGDTIDQGIIAQTFKMSGTLIVTPNKVYDPNNEFDEEYFEFSLFMSRREYKTINRRIQRGRIASINEGKYISPVPPYGYTRVKIVDDKGYTLKPHPEESEAVKLIYELYTRGELKDNGTYERLGTDLIASKLDSLKISPRKSDTWSKATIRDILCNPVYIGKIKWQERKNIKQSINGEVKITRPRQAPEDFILVDGLHEGIIDLDIFNLAQKQMKINNKNPITNNNIMMNPLTGIVICKKCGSTMTRLGPNSKNKYAFLKCPNKYCDNVSAPLYLVEDKILESLKSWVQNYQLDYKKEINNPISSSMKIKELSLNNLYDEVSKLKMQLSKTYDLLEQGIYSNELFLERNKSISDKIESYSNDINDFENDLKKDKRREIEKEQIIPNIKSMLKIYKTLDSAQAKNELLNNVIEKVIYVKTERNTRGKRDIANFEITVFPMVPKK